MLHLVLETDGNPGFELKFLSSC